MKIGVIKYRKYEERVLLNQFFRIDDLFRIILEDKDFVWFNIIDEKEKVVCSTWYADTKHGARFVEVVNEKVRKEVEILGTTYNAYNDPPLTHRTKTTWKVGTIPFRTRKKAREYIEQTNRRAKYAIEREIAKKD